MKSDGDDLCCVSFLRFLNRKMKTSKNITTLFQEGSQQLQVQPSPQAWQKLERRLDQHADRRGRIVIMRWATAAAAMLVLAAGVYLWNTSIKQEQLSMQFEPAPQHLEVLENTQGCQPYCMVLRARKELPDYYANPVQKDNL